MPGGYCTTHLADSNFNQNLTISLTNCKKKVRRMMKFGLFLWAVVVPASVTGFAPGNMPSFGRSSFGLRRGLSPSEVLLPTFGDIDGFRKGWYDRDSLLAMNAKKKAKKGDKKGTDTKSRDFDEGSIATKSAPPPEFQMDMPLPMKSMGAGDVEVDKDVKKLIFDRSLETKFQPIPKGALVDEPTAKRLELEKKVRTRLREAIILLSHFPWLPVSIRIVSLNGWGNLFGILVSCFF